MPSNIFKIKILIPILGLFVLIFMMFFVIHYGNDMGVPDRVKNIIFAIYTLGFFYIVTIAHFAYLNEIRKIQNEWLGIIIIIVAVMVSIYFSGQNLKTMYTDVGLGIAKRYDQEMTQRYAQIRESKSDSIYLAPLKNIPKSLCFDEIKTNEKHLWNKCYATYFEKKVIILKE